jgi:hypothetical protein
VKAPDRTKKLDLMIYARDRETPPAGIRACPPFLTEDIWCLPGESLDQLIKRAIRKAVGNGSAFTTVFYADEVVH